MDGVVLRLSPRIPSPCSLRGLCSLIFFPLRFPSPNPICSCLLLLLLALQNQIARDRALMRPTVLCWSQSPYPPPSTSAPPPNSGPLSLSGVPHVAYLLQVRHACCCLIGRHSLFESLQETDLSPFCVLFSSIVLSRTIVPWPRIIIITMMILSSSVASTNETNEEDPFGREPHRIRNRASFSLFFSLLLACRSYTN